MNVDVFIFKCLRKLFGREGDWYSEEFVEYRDQAANDYVRNAIHGAKAGLMVSKFGTIELEHLCCMMSGHRLAAGDTRRVFHTAGGDDGTSLFQRRFFSKR